MTDAPTSAEQLKPFAKLDGKPILASWIGGPALDARQAILNTASIPTEQALAGQPLTPHAAFVRGEKRESFVNE